MLLFKFSTDLIRVQEQFPGGEECGLLSPCVRVLCVWPILSAKFSSCSEILLNNAMGAANRVDKNLGTIWMKCLNPIRKTHLGIGMECSYTYWTST